MFSTLSSVTLIMPDIPFLEQSWGVFLCDFRISKQYPPSPVLKMLYYNEVFTYIKSRATDVKMN